jgi:hypothetical protein
VLYFITFETGDKIGAFVPFGRRERAVWLSLSVKKNIYFKVKFNTFKIK